jgi:hypothetical protein
VVTAQQKQTQKGEDQMPQSISRRAFMAFGGLALAGVLSLAQAAPVSLEVPFTGAPTGPAGADSR